MLEELNKYLGTDVTYDPYAVSLGIRFRLEKLIYDLLDDDKRIEFIDTHQTDKKLKYAEEHYKLNHPVIRNIVKNIFNNQSVLTIDFIH